MIWSGFFYYSVSPDWPKKTCLGIVRFLLKYMYVVFHRLRRFTVVISFTEKYWLSSFKLIQTHATKKLYWKQYIFPVITIGCFDEFVAGCALLFVSQRLRKLRFDDISLLHCCTASLQRSAEVAWIFKFWIINFWRI